MRRPDARCPWCGSLERHRCEWLYLVRKTDLFDGRNKTVLHLAPEACLETLFRQRFDKTYVTADLVDPHAMLRMDVMEIPFRADRFDVLLCSHVLANVSNDGTALSEFYRILKPGGWAILLEDIQENPTFEDPVIADSKERLRWYGHHDYVRRYGPDFIGRVQEAGFTVDIVAPQDIIDPAEFALYGMAKAVDDIYYCKKLDNKDTISFF